MLQGLYDVLTLLLLSWREPMTRGVDSGKVLKVSLVRCPCPTDENTGVRAAQSGIGEARGRTPFR